MQTELSDFGRELATDGGQQQAQTFDPEAETVTEDWEGVFISCAWGYNQTNRDYAQIVEVSDSGKTVLCRRVGAEIVDRPNKTTEHTVPTAEHVGPEFRLHVRAGSGKPSFKGSYPYIWKEIADGEDDPSTRMGLFLPCDNNAKPDYQTAPNAGH